jgi:hypothetical protein
MACQTPTRAYPWLLFASTAIAAVFCFMYISKPMLTIAPAANPIAASPRPLTTSATSTAAADQPALTKPANPAPPHTSMLPNTERLPGDAHAPLASKTPPPPTPHKTSPGAPVTPTFEETNLRIQHILTAQTPGGDISRLVLNVPVLYQTRNLAWTEREVAEARELLKRLANYQENSRAIRDEGNQILAAWNQLVALSIPTSILRADSPSLPANQHAADSTQQPAGLDTAESIQIQPAAP